MAKPAWKKIADGVRGVGDLITNTHMPLALWSHRHGSSLVSVLDSLDSACSLARQVHPELPKEGTPELQSIRRFARDVVLATADYVPGLGYWASMDMAMAKVEFATDDIGDESEQWRKKRGIVPAREIYRRLLNGDETLFEYANAIKAFERDMLPKGTEPITNYRSVREMGKSYRDLVLTPKSTATLQRRAGSEVGSEIQR